MHHHSARTNQPTSPAAKTTQSAQGGATMDDRRPEKGEQEELQKMVNSSPQMQDYRQAQQTANAGIHTPGNQQKPGQETESKEKEEEKEEGLPMEIKKERLHEAKSFVQVMMDKAETQDEVTAQFPAIKERFGLKKLEWKSVGDQQEIFMKINPEATIRSSQGKLLLGPWHTEHVPDAGRVEFRPGQVSLNGNNYNVGMEMEAFTLGPHHPQGGPPSSQALSNIMSVLPTDPKLKAGQKYIKGHLLNDNLGGPGSMPNLFPITAAANKQHESEIESYVKHWVNEKGWWVYYKVKVDNIQKKTINEEEMLNADFVCHANPLDSNGKRILSKGISTRIQSRIHKIKNTGFAGTDDTLPEAEIFGSPEKAENFDKDQVLWSTSKGDPSLPQEVDPEISRKTYELFKLMKQILRDRHKAYNIIYGQLIKAGVNVNLDYFTKMITNPFFEIHHTSLKVGTWNNMINLLSQNKSVVINWVDRTIAHLKEDKVKKHLIQVRMKNKRRLEREVKKSIKDLYLPRLKRKKRKKKTRKEADKILKSKGIIKPIQSIN